MFYSYRYLAPSVQVNYVVLPGLTLVFFSQRMAEMVQLVRISSAGLTIPLLFPWLNLAAKSVV